MDSERVGGAIQAEDPGPQEIAAYGIGDFGFNLFYTGLNLFLLYYYTDVLGIPPALAGLIFMLPVVWDGLTDPAMGWIATRTRSRFGRYRPYLLYGAPLMSLSFVSMFAAPLLFPDAVVAASAVAHLFFRTAYTVVSIPYTSLSAAMTNDSRVRGRLAGMRMFSAMVGGLVTASVTLDLARYLGGQSLRQGFLAVSVIYAVVATLVLLSVFANSRERSRPGLHGSVIASRHTLRFLRRNKAFWILFAAVLVGSLSSSVGGKALVYYVAYYVGEPGSVSQVLALNLLCAAVSIPFWTMISRRVSKRRVWLVSAGGSMCIQIALYLLAPREISPLLLLTCCNSFFAGAIALTFWSMLPDTVEYGEWRSRIRDEAIVFGLNQFALKAASGLGVGLLGLGLGAIGYLANQAQTPETLAGLRSLSFLVPLAGSAIAASIIWFYPLDLQLHQRLVNGLDWRRRRGVAIATGTGTTN